MKHLKRNPKDSTSTGESVVNVRYAYLLERLPSRNLRDDPLSHSFCRLSKSQTRLQKLLRLGFRCFQMGGHDQGRGSAGSDQLGSQSATDPTSETPHLHALRSSQTHIRFF